MLKWLSIALGWLSVGVGWLVGIVGLVLTATGFFAIIGLPLVAVAVVLVTSGMFVISPAEELLARLPVRPQPLILRVVGVRGGCPRGLQVGAMWRIAGEAKPPLCHAALDAVNLLLEQSSEPRERLAACSCPLGDYGVTFGVQAA